MLHLWNSKRFVSVAVPTVSTNTYVRNTVYMNTWCTCMIRMYVYTYCTYIRTYMHTHIPIHLLCSIRTCIPFHLLSTVSFRREVSGIPLTITPPLVRISLLLAKIFNVKTATNVKNVTTILCIYVFYELRAYSNILYA